MENNQKVQELYVEFQMLTQHLKQLQQQQQILSQQMMEMAASAISLEDIAHIKEGAELLVPVSNGMFAKAKLTDGKNVIVNIGSNVAVLKTTADAKVLMEKQIKESEELSKKISFQVDKFQRKAVALQKQLQELLPRE
jgi:prefoldin alpha subunit